MKYVIFLGDGMADYPNEALGGKTILQAAEKPNMDRIAREGRAGLFQTLQADLPTGSAVANLSVMGYDPRECFQGRGVLEAASMGVDVPDGAVAMRCNLICTENGNIKNHSAGHISSEESAELLETLSNAVTEKGWADRAAFHVGVSYRHLCILPNANPAVECAPPHDHPNEAVEGLLPTASTPDAEATAAFLRDLIALSTEVFADHPVNVKRREADKDQATSIWLWSPGVRPDMWTYRDRFGVSGAVISAVDLIFGIGVYAGLEKIEVEGATGLFDTNYEGKADACLKALERHDFVYLHVEAPDEAGHEGDLELKKRTIEDLDRRCIGRVMAGLGSKGIEATLAILPDHPTPVSMRIHTREAVPVAIWNPNQPADDVQAYDEVSCSTGSFGTFEGDQFIKTFFGKED